MFWSCRCIEDYGGFQAPRSDSFKEPRVFNTKLAVSIVVTHINLFFVTEHGKFVLKFFIRLKKFFQNALWLV